MSKLKSLNSIANQMPNTEVYGEKSLPFAPQVQIGDGQAVVPQQYLKVDRNITNIEEVLNKIKCLDNYLLFAHQENRTLSIQVGVIGCENYPRNNQQKKQKKIVYGRRWLIEPSAPTSEVIQTSMLAIKKAREHELRESVIVTVDGVIKTTPFNTHMDLPLMRANERFLAVDKPVKTAYPNKKSVSAAVEQLLRIIIVNKQLLNLKAVHSLGEKRFLIDLYLSENKFNNHFPELNNKTLSIFCDDFSESQFMHELMNQLIKQSDRYIEEQFSFDGFERFTHDLCPQKIAKFSHRTRKIKNKDSRFDAYFDQMSYEVDSAKSPFYGTGNLGRKQREAIQSNNVEGGHLPQELINEEKRRSSIK